MAIHSCCFSPCPHCAARYFPLYNVEYRERPTDAVSGCVNAHEPFRWTFDGEKIEKD